MRGVAGQRNRAPSSHPSPARDLPTRPLLLRRAGHTNLSANKAGEGRHCTSPDCPGRECRSTRTREPAGEKKKTPSETPRIPTAVPSQSPSDRKEAAASPATPAPSSSPSCTFRRRPARLAGNTVIDVSGPRAVCPWGPNPAERHWAPGVCAGGPYRTHQASLRQIQQGAEIQRSSKGSHPVPTPFVVGPQQGTGVRSGKQRHGPSVSF